MPRLSLLTDNSLFPISYSDGVTLLYAPLSDCVIEVSQQDLKRIVNILKLNGDSNDKEANEIVSKLTNVVPIDKRPGYVSTASDFKNLTILPTNKCNFSCSYCYSRAGRSNDVVDLDAVYKTLEWFVANCAKPNERLHITIYGGGEPMLVWKNTVKPILVTIGNFRKSTGVNIGITLITNGSILPKDFIDYIKTYNVDLVVSFEVLRELQDRHRRNYDKVSENIHILINHGIIPRINTVITSESTDRLREIVDTMHSEYPRLDYISLEPENANNLCDSFYNRFANSFFKTIEYARNLGITITCSALRNCDVTVNRYCAGEFALTATGKFTLCPCIASESQPGFENWVYGKADREKIEIDYAKLQKLLSINLESMPLCHNCFAKYNCGGGCLNNFIQNDNRPNAGYCNFMRNFLKTVIRQRYDQSISKY